MVRGRRHGTVVARTDWPPRRCTRRLRGDAIVTVDRTRLIALDADGRVRWQYGPLPTELSVLGVSRDGTVYVHHEQPGHFGPDLATAPVAFAVDGAGIRTRGVLFTDGTPGADGRSTRRWAPGLPVRG